ncbi:MAG: metallophosphoesterase [Candidatus Hydrogenedentes bacterium]|nr:metallophosphoesterase [Candidatus Hydrogenedentota bacterium]
MKLIHTSDLHLDMCFRGSGTPASFGNRRRQSMRDVFHGIIERAGLWPADALLIAGDLIELDRITRDTILFLVSEFESIPDVSVFIAPGNHDPYTPVSPYATAPWPENVTIFSKAQWEQHTVCDGRLTVHGFAFDGPTISKNPFGDLQIERGASDDSIHVAVGHGSERDHQPPGVEDYAPFSAKDAACDGLRYLALGHFHSVTEIAGPYDTVVYYSGSPEGHDFREPGTHHYLEVEIDGPEVSVRRVPSSRSEFAVHTLSCEGSTHTQHMVEAIRRIARQAEVTQIARITLTGPGIPEITGQMGSIYDAIAEEFEFLDLRDRTDPPEDFTELEREGTSMGVFVQTINEEIRDAANDGARQMLVRARTLGVAAFRKRPVEILGLEQR